jgi:hypothetical protein
MPRTRIGTVIMGLFTKGSALSNFSINFERGKSLSSRDDRGWTMRVAGFRYFPTLTEAFNLPVTSLPRSTRRLRGAAALPPGTNQSPQRSVQDSETLLQVEKSSRSPSSANLGHEESHGIDPVRVEPPRPSHSFIKPLLSPLGNPRFDTGNILKRNKFRIPLLQKEVKALSFSTGL